MAGKTYTDSNLQERANACIAGGALTNSKRPSCFVEGVYPTHLTCGLGAIVYDPTGKRYIDFIGGLGSSVLGYAHPNVMQAMSEQMTLGTTLSLGTPLEVEVAEMLQRLTPCAERIRFLKTGTEACMAAVRIARAATGRKKVLSEGYHGHADLFVSLTPPAHGVEGVFHVEHFKDFTDIDAETACVILEPVNLDWSDDRKQHLKEIRKRCNEVGALLIFDEIITGFRFPEFCVANYFGVDPDIILLGKAIANGMPLSVVAGRASVMNCAEYFVSSTFAGETISLAAAREVLRLLHGQYKLSTLWDQGAEWLKRFNRMFGPEVTIEGYPTRGRLTGKELPKAFFMQQACESGLLFGPSWFYGFSQMKQDDIVFSTLEEVLCKLNLGVKLKGEMPKSPFADKLRLPQELQQS